MTLSNYEELTIPVSQHPHWTECLDDLKSFWYWCYNVRHLRPSTVLEALEIVTLCDWRKSQRAAKEKILTWLGVSPQ
jgi:hypothetical protein